MFDTFLNYTLQIVIALDILGLIAYFVLGGFKPKSQKKLVPPATPSLRDRFSWRRRRDEPDESLEPALDNLRRVLYSYQRGLV